MKDLFKITSNNMFESDIIDNKISINYITNDQDNTCVCREGGIKF